MYGTNFHAPQVNIHDFSMVPRADIPRSRFRLPTQNKLTFQASNLTPIYVQEILPGDHFTGNMTAFCRLATPIFPIMDQIDLETWFFFVPCRILWTHWNQFMGEQANPGDSISYTIPQIVSPANGFAQLSIYDYFGLPCAGQTGAGGQTISVNALPLRAYNRIWNDWFRDQNLQSSLPVDTGDGPDLSTDYTIRPVNKRHDYFTACLPYTQKGNAPSLPLFGQATVKTASSNLFTGAQLPINFLQAAGTIPAANSLAANASGFIGTSATPLTMTGGGLYPANLYADLSTASAMTVNILRLAIQTQKLLEREARGGSRLVEIILSHFGVRVPDFRLQRPEICGGGKTPITITPVPQTVPSTLSGTSNPPMGSLAAAGTLIAKHGFRYAATEHGYLIGLAAVRTQMGYQQGIRRLWSRKTKYDFYFPVFQAIGEQPVLNSEIFSDGTANDALTFGFQEAWAAYRNHPSTVCGYFRSTNSTPLDSWHMTEKFTSLPTLGSAFMFDSTQNQLQRAVAAGPAATNQQILADLYFDVVAARPLPMYSVPGHMDHF